MVKHIYLQRPTTQFNTPNQSSHVPIIHTNVSTYTQALMTFHESNPVSEQSSQKWLKVQFNVNSPSTKK